MQAPTPHPGSIQPGATPIRRQHGSMAIAMMLMLLGLISILGIVEVGYLYWAHRDAQKVADLAALSGAQQLPDCVKASGAAASNAKDNGAPSGAAPTDGKFHASLTTNDCGTWTPPTKSGADGFTSDSANPNANAVKVIAGGPAPSIWGFAGALPNVSAEAVASQQSPIAAFSVGTKLVAVDGESTLGQLLKGIGIPLDGTSLVGYEGLANVNITPAGLLEQLGIPIDAGITVGGLNALLAEQKDITVGQLLDAIVTVAGRQDLVSANADLLNAILADASVPGVALKNVTLGGPGGLFAEIVAPAGAAQAALNAQVNALQLIATAIGVGTGKHAIEVPNTDIKLGNLLQFTASARVIEPPSIGIGGKGTTAYTAQIRAFLHIFVDTDGVPLVGDLLGQILGTQIKLDLPIAIDLVGAKGTLGDICSETDDQGRELAPIHVDSSVLKACVGNITQDNAFSTVTSCDQISGANENKDLLSLSLAGAQVLDLNTHFSTTALPASGDVTLYEGQTAPVGNDLEIGTTVSNLFTALTTALIANSNAQQPSQTNPDDLAKKLWDATNAKSSNLTRTNQALNQLQSSSQGLNGLLYSPVSQVTDILGNTLSLNIPGVLNGVGGLLKGVGNVASQLLNGLGCTLGGDSSCINLISDAASSSSSGTYSNALVGVLGLVLQTLAQPLDLVGSKVLTPLLQKTLGLDLGKTDVHLQSLQCHRVQLVY